MLACTSLSALFLNVLKNHEIVLFRSTYSLNVQLIQFSSLTNLTYALWTAIFSLKQYIL